MLLKIMNSWFGINIGRCLIMIFGISSTPNILLFLSVLFKCELLLIGLSESDLLLLLKLEIAFTGIEVYSSNQLSIFSLKILPHKCIYFVYEWFQNSHLLYLGLMCDF